MKSSCPQCSAQTSSDGLCHRCLLLVGIEMKHANNAIVSDVHIPTIEELGQCFPQLEIKRLVGRGGMGAIYHARQTSLDRDVAIKIIDRRISNDGPFLDRFEREARALAKLSHPNIVTVYDYGQTEDGLAYFVMEYVNGLNLREAMEAMAIDANESVDYIKTICSALNYAHSKGVVHRDIKPENILLGDDGSLKIADFGIAKIVDSQSPKQITATRHILGTPHYLAPEQLDSPNEADHRVDIYAVGVVLYELLTHQLPVGTFEAPSQINSALDHRYDSIVSRALNRRPTGRFQSAEELRQALDQVQAGPEASYEVVDNPGLKSQFSYACVPFERDDWAGFAEARGTIQATETGLLLEYQVSDKLWGKFRSILRSIALPWNRVVGVEFQKGLFRSKFVIVGDSISALQNFPGSESGRIEVEIKNSEATMADRVVERARIENPKLNAISLNPWSLSATANYTVAILLIFFGIVNAGFLAIVQVLGGFHLNGWMLATCAIASSVLLGPLIVVQIVTGVLHAITGNPTIARVGVLTTMLPVSPMALFGLPFGIWSRTAFSEPVSSKSTMERKTVAKGWGATTLVFMRDSRNARVIALLETVGCLVILAAIGLFSFGFYPALLHYRLVGQKSSSVASDDSTKENPLRKAVEDRLLGLNCNLYFQGNTGLSIRCWQFQRQSVLERLALSTAPSIQRMVASEATSIESDIQYLPILTSIPLDEVFSRQTPTGLEVQCSGSAISLESAWISRVEIMGLDQLRLVLSKDGNEALRQQSEQLERRRLGLVIDGWIEGISLESIRDRHLTFRMSEASKRSLTSIQAAVRGPALPQELELLD